MEKYTVWHRIAYTSRGLYRMSRGAIKAFFEQAYDVGKDTPTPEERAEAACERACDRACEDQ